MKHLSHLSGGCDLQFKDTHSAKDGYGMLQQSHLSVQKQNYVDLGHSLRAGFTYVYVSWFISSPGAMVLCTMSVDHDVEDLLTFHQILTVVVPLLRPIFLTSKRPVFGPEGERPICPFRVDMYGKG